MKKQYGLLCTWTDPETGEHQWAFKPDDTPLNELAKFQQELEATAQNVTESETKGNVVLISCNGKNKEFYRVLTPESANLMLTFDIKTGDLKSAEVLKE